MNGSFRTLGVTLGAAVLVAMAPGCSRTRQQPARTPSPTFESNVPEQTVPPPMGTTAPPMGAAMPPETEQPAVPETAPSRPAPMGTETPSPGTTEPTPSAAPTPAPAMASDLCDSLTHAATIREEDVPGGVAIVLTPKPHETMDTVRDDARKFQMTFSQLSAETMGRPPGGAGAAAPPPGPSTCAIADVMHMSANASVSEGPKAVRILITTSDPGQVRPIRRTVRDYARTTGGARGAAPGAKPGGGAPRH